MKVVINRCYGGYGLSDFAVKRYIELRGLELFAEEKGGRTSYYRIEVDEYKRELEEEERLFREKSPEYKGHPSNRHCWSFYKIKRDDPVLIRVIEELGGLANGEHAELKVVEIPDDVEYRIVEYDGCERIDEVHRSWS
jgi:hypothetical protein